MNISLSGVLSPERVQILNVETKREALEQLIGLLGPAREITDPAALARGVFEREALMSTGIGLGVGVPHVRLPSVTDVVMAAGLSDRDIVDYESLDGQPVRLILMIAARPDQHAAYLRLLSLISMRLKDEPLRSDILASHNAGEFYRLLLGDDTGGA